MSEYRTMAEAIRAMPHLDAAETTLRRYMTGAGDDLDVAAGRCCPHCRHMLTEHNVAVWNAGYSVAMRHAKGDIAQAWDDGWHEHYLGRGAAGEPASPDHEAEPTPGGRMTEQTEPQAGPVVKVARDLTEIERLVVALGVELRHLANDRLMPGGRALVALARDADLDEWAEMIATAELRHFAACDKADHKTCTVYGAEHVEDEDDQDAEDPLRTLLFWSDAWREQYGYPLEGRVPTLLTEAHFIRGMLDAAWRAEVKWDDFAKDVADVRRRLEDLVHAGTRIAARGVPCMYDECKGKRLIRKMVPGRDDAGHKVWRLTDWHCPSCKRSWSEDQYARQVTAANERAKAEDIYGDLWVSDDYAARKVGRSVKTIRTWVNRGLLATVCLVAGRRSKFVNLDEVRERHEESQKRTTAA